ncbi:MAG: hypothetical protein ACNA8H_14475, partial [Anaerolineales bacterium]
MVDCPALPAALLAALPVFEVGLEGRLVLAVVFAADLLVLVLPVDRAAAFPVSAVFLGLPLAALV